ncbi:hypothetical protein W822_07495 [Advenella kashmirensis W13003]|uniref:FAD-dependent oxidoreductase 2 FAD-binding domain-containing protein n=1 Tax=Advenella kashmirensis W13003 TaxID=1424334 RepID=V8QTM0_9BURK|nr:FAD-dependent oxidoreductase [Advenella kashmirensis]ETF02688.1 hypothetical protein W822_07495 [Advenella kashmirensis W13003]
MESVNVCVIGAGLAGMSAALRTAEEGFSVIVLERGVEQDYLCNTRLTGGAFHVCLSDIQLPADELNNRIQAATEGAAHAGLSSAVAEDARRAVKWLQSQGVRFIKGGAEPHHNFVLSPPSLQRVGADWRGRGGDVLLRTLTSRLANAGGVIKRGHRAHELLVENGKCVGVKGRSEKGEFSIHADNVVIADGGFQCDQELIREHITPDPDKVLQRNARTGLGDGLKMARQAGAKLSGLVGFYGHVLSADALKNDKLWPMPWLDNIATAAIVVDRQGKRFADEGRGGVYIANQIAALPDPLSATVIFDQPLWANQGTSRFFPPNPHLEKLGGTLIRADSIVELAEKLDIDATTLQATVSAYNDAVVRNDFSALQPARRSSAYKAEVIDTGPFYAVPVCAGMTYTMGGVAIDEWSRVLRDDDSIFPGLYAAGGASGGLEGGQSIGYVGGLSKAATTGMRAGEHIASTCRQRVATR